MGFFRQTSILSILLLLTPKALALQVTPNSPCAPICMDDPSLDVSDPNSSNTYPKDIVCNDADYENTVAGRKFESCVNCLRNSTASGSGENDQSWFLYNLRYGLDSCLFSFTNDSDATSTPCSTSSSCGPLQQSLEDGNFIPANESTYSYCSADHNALLGSSLTKCISCLQDASTETYLANFLVVLQAGCVQQPPVGTNIGIRGDIFSSSLINITYPGDNGGSTSANRKKGLRESAIIGIVCGSVILAVSAIVFGFICYRKRHQSRSMKRLTSPLDFRFGSKSISSPSSGAYSNPYASPPTQAVQQFDGSALSEKELKALGLAMPNFSKQYPVTSMLTEQGHWEDAHAHLEATESQRQSFPASMIPTHQAYVPAQHAQISPATSNETIGNNTYQISPYSSTKSSPTNLPPPRAPKPIVKAAPPPIKVPQPRIQTTPQQVQPAQFNLPTHHEETSQQTRPGLYSQQPQTQPSTIMVADNHPPSRNNSIAGSWRQRARSTSRNGRNRSTSRNGGRNRSNSRNGFRDTNASMDVPVRISGPMIQHGGRFDFDMAERDERAVDRRRKHPDATPSSAESEEQWPGAY